MCAKVIEKAVWWFTTENTKMSTKSTKEFFELSVVKSGSSQPEIDREDHFSFLPIAPVRPDLFYYILHRAV